MLRFLVLLLAVGQVSAPSIPATDVAAADFERTLTMMQENGATDTPIRTVDAGGHNVGVSHCPSRPGERCACGHHSLRSDRGV